MKKLQKTRSKTKSFSLPPQAVSSNLMMAELSIQRGDVEQGRVILEKRIAQGANDFKTLNLYGVALAHGRKYDNANTIFRRLQAQTRNANLRAKAQFNLGQVLFYQDLSVTGDQSVSRSLFSQPGRTILPIVKAQPYSGCVEVWDAMLRRKVRHSHIIHTYLAFTCQQLGYLDHALGHAAAALSHNEGFYITHYVLGRIFTDLFLLAAEGNHYSLEQQMANFFEIETFEITREEGGRVVINRDTFLDIALQALLDARGLSPLSACIYLAMCEVYLFAGLIEEAQESLAHAEALAPNALTTLEASLRFHEFVRSSPEVIRSLLARIKVARRREAKEIYYIIPSYYMF